MSMINPLNFNIHKSAYDVNVRGLLAKAVSRFIHIAIASIQYHRILEENNGEALRFYTVPVIIGFTDTRSSSHSALIRDVYYPFCCQSSNKSRVSVLREPPICPQVLTAAAAHAHRYL
ncbi:hypothetical protein J6590_085957 [Homalodisca vitripennis]|nr:hypothetical protein J6590_085957 [Homalodisca vitripennis]